MREISKSDTQYLTEDVLELISVTADKKATFNSEVNAITGLRKNKITQIKADLIDLGILEDLRPKTVHSDKRLLSRRVDMWTRGVTGQGDFGSRSWFGLNSDHTWRLRYTGADEWYIVDEFHRLKFSVNREEYDEPIQLVNGKPINQFVGEKYDSRDY